MKVLVYGYGNPGREDDGLGIACTEILEEWVQQNGWDNFAFDMNYQLNIEDALEISQYDAVLFIDASTEPIDDFIISEVEASDKVNFTMHSASPSYIKHLCKQIYNIEPLVYLIHIKGYNWSMKEGIGEQASANLDKTVRHLKKLLIHPDWTDKINNFLGKGITKPPGIMESES